jgi:hypothetical protein
VVIYCGPLDGERVPGDGSASQAWCAAYLSRSWRPRGAVARLQRHLQSLSAWPAPLDARRPWGCAPRTNERGRGCERKTLANGGERAAGSKPNCVHRRSVGQAKLESERSVDNI